MGDGWLKLRLKWSHQIDRGMESISDWLSGHLRLQYLDDGGENQPWSDSPRDQRGRPDRCARFESRTHLGVVKQGCQVCNLGNLSPHDLRHTCARRCHQRGGDLEQIQFLLGDMSVQTTERYLGCKQRLRDKVHDLVGIEPELIKPEGRPTCRSRCREHHRQQRSHLPSLHFHDRPRLEIWATEAGRAEMPYASLVCGVVAGGVEECNNVGSAIAAKTPEFPNDLVVFRSV
ncbi:tyrosine-type recombinase/integrase [Paludibaculum fermentans]|uniref:tyrosine-type recombinase/integrase n=1 Tax=Paludibaculum fermentans TaxID=1473598 RepID=UPI003EB81C66